MVCNHLVLFPQFQTKFFGAISSMSNANPDEFTDVMHGVTLKLMVTRLVEEYGWHQLAKQIPINCFRNDPTLNSSLKFLRKTPWARSKVEQLYMKTAWRNQNQW